MIEAGCGRFVKQRVLAAELRTDDRLGTSFGDILRYLWQRKFGIQLYRDLDWSLLAGHLRRGDFVMLFARAGLLWGTGELANHCVMLQSVRQRRCTIVDPGRKTKPPRYSVSRRRLRLATSDVPIAAVVIQRG